jgi:hypothetical protein
MLTQEAGSTEDPKDGAKVAAAVFGAVIVYAVSSAKFAEKHGRTGVADQIWVDIPPVLRLASLPTRTAASTWRDSAALVASAGGVIDKKISPQLAILRRQPIRCGIYIPGAGWGGVLATIEGFVQTHKSVAGDCVQNSAMCFGLWQASVHV